MRHEHIKQVHSACRQARTTGSPVDQIEVLYVEPRHISTHLYVGIEKFSFFTRHNGVDYTLLFTLDTMTSNAGILGAYIKTFSDNESRKVNLGLLKYDEDYKEYLKASVDSSSIDVIRALENSIQTFDPDNPAFFHTPLSLPPIMR